MRIESSSLGLHSSRSAHSLYEKKEFLQINTNDANGNAVEYKLAQALRTEQQSLEDITYFSAGARSSALKNKADQLGQQISQTQNQNNPSPINPEASDAESLFKLSLQDKLKIIFLLQILGRFGDPEMLKLLGLGDDEEMQTAANEETAAVPNTPQPGAISSVEYSASEVVYQAETVQFSALGEVHTADGKTIHINIDLLMHREALQTKDTYLKIQAVTKDPLVINLDGSAAELSEQRFSFDLTRDGINELIPKLIGNRGFLALDKNNDLIINDGTELFGAQTGNGFAELAQYDEDANGWIDERDSVFKQLKIWMDAGSAQQQLVSLKDANIGALYTGATATLFHLQEKDDALANLGMIQATGVFLKENGTAGTVQHVDLTV